MSKNNTVEMVDIEDSDDISFGDDNFEDVKEITINHLHKHKVAKVTVEFNGGHDEGSVSNVTIQFLDGNKIEIDEVDYKNLYACVCTPVYAEYDSFAMEGDVDGIVVWDINKDDKTLSKVLLTADQSYVHWEPINREF